MRTLDAKEPETPMSVSLRQTLAALNPFEIWRAWQEAADQVCLMAPVPLRQRSSRREPN